MKRTIAVGLAMAMALLGQAAPSMAQTGADRGYRDEGYRDEGYRDEGYRNEGYRDEGYRNEGWGDRAHRGGIDLEGRWIAKRGYHLPARARGGTGLQAVLPPRLVIDQRRNVIRLEDFRGRVLQQIVVGGWGGGGWGRRGMHRDDAVIGRWSDSKLLTIRKGIHNTRIVQIFALSNRGRTLVVTTRQEGMGTRHDLEFTNVYQRA